MTEASPRFVGTKPRTETVALEWPIEHEGKVYESVTVHRLTTREVAEYLERLTAAEGQTLPFPVYDVPDAVIEALDADDSDRVAEVVLRFLPRRFRAATESAPASPDGGSTSQSAPAT